MKLGKTSWLLLISGILIITFASLLFAGSRQIKQQEQLSNELLVAEQRVAKLQLEQLTSQQEQLKTQLDQANAELKSAKDKLRQSNESIDVTDFLFQIAKTCSVTITSVTSSGITNGEIEGIKCTVLPVTLNASGDVLDLIKFVSLLNTDFVTGVIKSADINIPETAEEQPSAVILLNIYQYQGG